MRALFIGFVILASAAISAQSAQYDRGQLVRVLPPASPNEGYSALVLRVVAAPGDRVRVSDSRLLVNEVAVSGFSPEFLDRVVRGSQRFPQVVPEMHYVVMGELRANGNVSEYWGLHPGARLEAVR
jgi:hypothetical protein